MWMILLITSTLVAQFPKKDATKQNFESFVFNVKKIKVHEHTLDDVVNLVGQPKWQGDFGGNKICLFDSPPESNFRVWFDCLGSVLGVQITKMNGFSPGQIIYLKGTPIGGENSSQRNTDKDHFPLSDSAPYNPTPGQIFFNSSDNHFYGWNGKEWLQLDNQRN